MAVFHICAKRHAIVSRYAKDRDVSLLLKKQGTRLSPGTQARLPGDITEYVPSLEHNFGFCPLMLVMPA